MGILDDVQMGIDFAEKERAMFWEEVFSKCTPTFEEALKDYELLKEYLLETFMEVDDWYQLTFYKIDWSKCHKDKNILIIQLDKPLNKYWESIIIPRMKDFFIERPCKYLRDAELISIKMYDKNHCLIKTF